MSAIAENRRARFDYHIEEQFEAGIVLDGWEVKAIRAGQVQLPEGFSDIDRALLTDPQTSGGLLVSCDAAAVADVMAVFQRHGFEAAAEVGEVLAAGAQRLVLLCEPDATLAEPLIRQLLVARSDSLHALWGRADWARLTLRELLAG